MNQQQPTRAIQQRLELPSYIVTGIWENVDPRTVLSKQYSSARGFKSVQKKLHQKDVLPGKTNGGAGCNV